MRSEKVQKKKLLVVFFLVLSVISVILASSLVAAEPSANSMGCVHYFYGQGCLGCDPGNQFIDQLAAKYPDLQIEKYEIYFLPENTEKLKEYFTAYSIPEASQGLPA